MQAKTTRAFRTISEAGEELGLQPHVLRFWESKFADIKPIKRGGGRRFYRPEDIEFLRGIKILLHDEKHPIKDVQKLIRVKGANSVVALGQSLQRAPEAKKVKETVLIPERIQKAPPPARPKSKPLNLTPSGDEKVVHFAAKPKEETPLELHEVVTEEPIEEIEIPSAVDEVEYEDVSAFDEGGSDANIEVEDRRLSQTEKENLEGALNRLENLRTRWIDFKKSES